MPAKKAKPVKTPNAAPFDTRQAVALERIATALESLATIAGYWHTAFEITILNFMKKRGE